MAISNMTLLTGTTVSATGGSNQVFAPDGTVVNRGISVSDVAGDTVIRPSVVAKNTPGVLQPDKTYSKDRRSIKYVVPEVLADGSTDFAFIEVTMVKSPLRGASTVNALKEKGAQLIIDSELANFWSMGSTL
jgi:hypothetical protein